ncbi:MAG: hypothetical protein AB1649_30515, partial [Chloroflexota bacterium]
GIVLAAGFYSFHHAGFQPEFVKLFFVGLMYMSVFRTTRSLLILYPLFWGVGACWDVLVQYGTAPEQLRWSYALVALGLMALAGIYFYRKAKRRKINFSLYSNKLTVGSGPKEARGAPQ